MVTKATPKVHNRMCMRKITIGKAALPSQMKKRTDRAESRQWALVLMGAGIVASLRL